MNTLYEIGLEDLCEDEKFFMNVVAKYTMEEGELFKGYYGNYIWRRLGYLELNFHISPSEDSNVVTGFTSNVSGNNFWRMAVTTHGIVEMPVEDDDKHDYLSRCINFTHPETHEGNVPINLVNADVVPDFYPGDTYTMQVVAFADSVEYYKDEEEYKQKPLTTLKGMPVLFRMNSVMGIIDGCIAVGEIKNVNKKHSYNAKGKRVEFYAIEIQTDYGVLEILHSEACVNDSQKDLIKPGMIIKAPCVLFGDVAVGDYQQGAILDEAHISRLLRGCFDSGDFTRVSRLLADDCKYIRFDGSFAADGGKEVFAFLTRAAKGLNAEEKNLSAYPATLVSYDEQNEVAPEDIEHKIGTPIIAISHKAGEAPNAFLVIKLNEENKISEIKSLGPKYGFYRLKINIPEDDFEDFSPIPTSFSEDEWLEMLGKRFEAGSFDDDSFYYGLAPECTLNDEQKWDIYLGEEVNSRETMFTYLSTQVTHEKHSVSYSIIDGKHWGHRKVLSLMFDGIPRYYAVDVDDEGHLSKLYEYYMEQ